MMRLDHNRAVAQLAHRLAVPVTAVRKLTVWGNHSTTQYPDLLHAEVNGKSAAELVDETWVQKVFIPTVAGRGAAVIEARGASSAASAANAAIDHISDWVGGTADSTWTSAGVVSDGSYGVPEGLIAGFPVVSQDGRYEIVRGLEINEFGRQRIDHSVAELVEERDLVMASGLVPAA
jgi:malate dehydrogenase